MSAPMWEPTGWRKSSYSGSNADCVEVSEPTWMPAGWHKSSYSGTNANCVEVSEPCALVKESTGWRKSSYSGSNANCVEVAESATLIAVRDSQTPQAGHLTFAVAEWNLLTRFVKNS